MACSGPVRSALPVIVAAMIVAALPHRAAAQGVPTPVPSVGHTIMVRADNDAFDFWMEPWDRPDQDYTSGVRVVLQNAWRPWWASRLWARDGRCSASNSAPCVTSSAWIGQDMYTAERDTSGNLETSYARPSAGWLYYGEELQRVSTQRADRVQLTLGVTGPPSLAQYTQQLTHSLAPAFNHPIDWQNQLAFEPGVQAMYAHDELRTPVSIGPLSMQIVPSVSATVGNVRTQGIAKLETRVGFNLRSPWLPASADGLPELAFSASTAGYAVARNLFLDGSTFRKDPQHVGHLPFYTERELGVSLVYNGFVLGYRTVFDGRMYAAGHDHAWASMTAGYVVSR